MCIVTYIMEHFRFEAVKYLVLKRKEKEKYVSGKFSKIAHITPIVTSIHTFLRVVCKKKHIYALIYAQFLTNK